MLRKVFGIILLSIAVKLFTSNVQQSRLMPQVTVYTDGGASGNPGPGGYGIVMLSGKHRKEINGGFRLTTNNRMELLAVIIALENSKV